MTTEPINLTQLRAEVEDRQRRIHSPACEVMLALIDTAEAARDHDHGPTRIGSCALCDALARFTFEPPTSPP